MLRSKSDSIALRRVRSSLICIATLVTAQIGAGTPAGAAFTTYFGIDQGNGTPPTTPALSLAARNAFVGSLTNVGVQNFDSLPLNTFPTTLSFGPTSITAAATTTDSVNNYVTNGMPNGTFATSGTQFLYQTGNGTLGINDTLTFSAPISGIGMYVTDLSDQVGTADQIQLVLTLANFTTQTFQTNVGMNNNNATLLFFGVISSDPTQAIAKVQILNTSPASGDAIGIDDLTIGQPPAVPEPASIVTMGTAMLGLVVGYVTHKAGRKDGEKATS